jgi:hypothetical protein
VKVRSARGPIESEVEAIGETSIDDARGERMNVEAPLGTGPDAKDSTVIERCTAAEPINGPMDMEELEPELEPAPAPDLP